MSETTITQNPPQPTVDPVQFLGNVVHTELVSNDTAATRTWMANVFGTQFMDMTNPGGEYFTFGNPSLGVGGAVRPVLPETESVPYAVPYFSVGNIDESIVSATENGGTIMVPKTAVPGYGYFSWINVPGGLTLAIWQNDATAAPLIA